MQKEWCRAACRSPKPSEPPRLRTSHGERINICRYGRLLLRLGAHRPMRAVTMNKSGSPASWVAQHAELNPLPLAGADIRDHLTSSSVSCLMLLVVCVLYGASRKGVCKKTWASCERIFFVLESVTESACAVC